MHGAALGAVYADARDLPAVAANADDGSDGVERDVSNASSGDNL